VPGGRLEATVGKGPTAQDKSAQACEALEGSKTRIPKGQSKAQFASAGSMGTVPEAERQPNATAAPTVEGSREVTSGAVES